MLEVLADERIRLVTMTITGTAYRWNPETGEFDPDDDEVRWGLDHPDEPRGVSGGPGRALERRRRAGIAPFTLLSCDNMEHDGAAARTAVVGFAAPRDEGLATWIAGMWRSRAAWWIASPRRRPPRNARRSFERSGSGEPLTFRVMPPLPRRVGREVSAARSGGPDAAAYEPGGGSG